MEGLPDGQTACRDLEVVFKSETLAGEEVRAEAVETEPGVFAHRLSSPAGHDHILARTCALVV